MRNNLFVFLLATLAGLTSFSKPKESLNIALNLYLPGVDFRYQDNMDQTQSLKPGLIYAVAAQLQDQFYLGLSYYSQTESSGNNSLSVESKSTDLTSMWGCKLYQNKFESEIDLGVFAVGYLGFNETRVTTQLLSQLDSVTTGQKSILGLGALLQLSYKSMLLEIDTAWMSSENYNPNSMSQSHIKLGYQIKF